MPNLRAERDFLKPCKHISISILERFIRTALLRHSPFQTFNFLFALLTSNGCPIAF